MIASFLRIGERPGFPVVGAVLVFLFSNLVRAEQPPPVDFNREIRPILSNNCFACHGPDDQKRKAGVRLDRRADAVIEAKSGSTPIVPGKPDESEVIDRVFSEDADRIMPPPATHKTLTTREKETLKRWIAGGAEYKEHWAFVRPTGPILPAVQDRNWPRNEIDAFALARMEKEGLRPSPEADRTTLLRRLSLDLIGLPPTIGEVEAFVGDPDPDAYEKVVDRLFASPHYGERWARRWLDRARYADTNGYEKDRERSIWPFRDWVIDALNRDMPFDRFTIEQIAGDMLPDSTPAQRVASGFHRNTMINEEGGIDVEEFRFASLVDRVATTGSVWLGLTIQCAQCHTHKFDPITQRDYYRFLAFFDNADEPDLELPSPEMVARRAEIDARIASMEADLESQFPARDESQAWQPLTTVHAVAASGSTLNMRQDGSILASGPAPETDSYEIVLETPLAEIAAIRIEAETDPKLPHTGPGRAPNGNFVLSTLRVTAEPIQGPGDPIPIRFDHAEADVSQHGFDVRGLIDDDPTTGWAIDDGSGHFNRTRSATFGVTGKAGFVGGTRLTVTLEQKYGGKHTLGRFRISARGPLSEATAQARKAHLAERIAAWEASIRPVKWTILTPSKVVSRKNATMTVLGDRSVLASGDKPNNDTYDVEIPADLKGITAIRLEVLADPSLPDGGPGRAPLFSVGDFLLTELGLAIGPEGRKIPWKDADQDHFAAGKSAAMAIDGKHDTGWSIAGGVGKSHAAVFTLKESLAEATTLALTIEQEYIHQTTIGRFRVSATTDAGPLKASGLPADVEEILTIPAKERSADQVERVKRHFLSIAPELKAKHEAIAALRKTLPKPPTSMVMQERDKAHARTTRLRTRGEFLRPAEAVSPDVPEVFPALAGGSEKNRLALAKWLVSAENPLTARVAMNQAWQAFFGRGIVATVEDFGTRGDEPTHPELLDWLATEFVRGGWSMKAMHRQIVLSATYRQSSRSTPESRAIDPNNTLLSRGPRFRVDAEMVRDLALTASGLLDPEIGGPSVFPPQPDGVTSLAYGMTAWPASVGKSRYRRGLYTFAKRTAPYASFATFDAPSPEIACVRRERSNTPLQALTLLNDVVFVEAARALGRRVMKEGPADVEGRVRLAFRLCLARGPSDRELGKLGDFVRGQVDRFRSDTSVAAKVAGVDGKRPEWIDVAELAGWTATARAILNLDETITKE